VFIIDLSLTRGRFLQAGALECFCCRLNGGGDGPLYESTKINTKNKFCWSVVVVDLMEGGGDGPLYESTKINTKNKFCWSVFVVDLMEGGGPLYESTKINTKNKKMFLISPNVRYCSPGAG
jgi:hypothetical protein